MKKKTFICAEIAQGYEGDVKLCKMLIKAAAKSGADAVKFQIFKANELCTTSYQYWDFFKSLEISYQDWNELIKFAKDLGLEFHSDVFGHETLEWMFESDISGIKLHSSDVKNYPLLKKASHFKGKIFLSTGGSHLNEIEKAINFLPKERLTLISGFQAEPNLPIDVELDKVEFLSEKFRVPVGYADHIDANDSMSISLPAMAVIKGASFIEKHLTIERNALILEDSISALNPNEFLEMVNLIRKVDGFAAKSKDYNLSDRELNYRKNTKKIPIAAREIMAGSVITAGDITFLRTGEVASELLDIDDIIGKTLNSNLSVHKHFTRENIL